MRRASSNASSSRSRRISSGGAADAVDYVQGAVIERATGRRLEWADLVLIAHRNFHLLPEGIEPGLEVTHVMQVPTGTALPTADGRVQMYPCHSFEFHIVLAAIDPISARPSCAAT